MEVRRDRYLNNLIDRMHNGMIKVITGVRRCGKTYLLFELFGNYLRDELGVGDDHIVEVALDEEANRGLRDPGALDSYLKSKIVNKTSQYYVMLDEVQYAISDEELRGHEPPRLYGVLNGLLRMRNVDVYATSSNFKLLSSDVMSSFADEETRSECDHCPSPNSCKVLRETNTRVGPSMSSSEACPCFLACARTSKSPAT